MPTLICFVQHSTRSCGQSIGQEKEIKVIQTGREEAKLIVFADDMIVYVENSQNSTKNKKTVRTSMNSVKLPDKKHVKNESQFYTSNTLSYEEIEKTIPSQ